MNKGTVFYAKHDSSKEILECLAMLADRNSLAAIHSIKEINEETDRDTFWRGTAIDIDTKLRVGRAVGKNEEEVAMAMMRQIRDHSNPIDLPAISSDGNDSYPEAMLETGESYRNTLAEDDLQHENNHNLTGNVFK